MSRSGMADRLLHFSNLIIGRVRGGFAYVNVMASLLFSGLTGVAVGDIAALGKIQVRAMEKAGYPRHFAAAVTVASSLVGPIIPPSGVIILYCAIMNVSVGGMFLAALDQMIGTGDGAMRTFQLRKAYGEGEDAYPRPVTKPVAGSVRVAVDGVERQTPDDFEVDHLTGVVTFQPGSIPSAGAAVTAGFEFDVSVRFDIEQIAVSLAAFEAGQIPSIPLVEVRA
jgi:hypothetical protein